MPEGEEGYEKLHALLHDSEPEVRGMAAVALAHAEGAWATDLLVEMLDDSDHRIRCAAISSLGERGDTRATPALIQQMQSGDTEVRCCTLAAFALIGDARSFASVVTALFDVDDEVRRNAAGAIGYLGDRRALEPLVILLDDDVAGVRANAALSLGMLGTLDTAEPLLARFEVEQDDNVRSNLVIALIACNPLQESLVIDTLLDGGETERVRISACIALARASSNRRLIDEGAATDALLRALGRGDAADELRATLVWALGRVKRSPEVTRALSESLDDDYSWVVIYTVESLALEGDEAILASLRDYRERHLGEDEIVRHTDEAIAQIELDLAESEESGSGHVEPDRTESEESGSGHVEPDRTESGEPSPSTRNSL